MTISSIDMQKILEEVKRGNTRKKKNIGVRTISVNGTKIHHALGIVPDEFNITPLMSYGAAPAGWYHYREPDSEYIYLKASATGSFLICVAGG